MNLNFPTYELKLRIENNKHQVFDILRKKWVVLTPEEWVRQHLIHFLKEDKNYPVGLMASEMYLPMNGMRKRTDLTVFNRKGEPILIAECKRPTVKINQKTFDQIAGYNWELRVPYLILTNGLEHFCCTFDLDSKEYSFSVEFPDYDKLL